MNRNFLLGKFGFLIPAIALIISQASLAQEKQSPPKTVPATNSSRPAASKSKQDPKLLDLTRVSTDGALRSAAREAAQKGHPKEGQGQAKDNAGNSAVMEFHPVAHDSQDESAIHSADNSRPKAKNIHGDVYGALDGGSPGHHEEGGAVGAGSKSGKMHVYVQTDQTRSSTTSPH